MVKKAPHQDEKLNKHRTKTENQIMSHACRDIK
jgi:tRNA A-37 threonylcarbamoyl transferase component Bud32